MVVDAENVRLREHVGAALVAKRAACSWTQRKLAEVPGVSLRSIEMLTTGDLRPSVFMCWRLVRALRRGFGEQAVAALAARLGDLVRPSLRDYACCPRRRGTRLVQQAHRQAGDGITGARGTMCPA